jgi:hypothetical protein
MGLHFVFGGNIKGLARDIRSYRGAWNEHFTSIVCSGFFYIGALLEITRCFLMEAWCCQDWSCAHLKWRGTVFSNVGAY